MTEHLLFPYLILPVVKKEEGIYYQCILHKNVILLNVEPPDGVKQLIVGRTPRGGRSL